MFAVVAAMEEELSGFVKLTGPGPPLEDTPFRIVSAEVNGIEFLLCSTGIGKVLTASAVQFLIDRFPCSGIIHTGLAGALTGIPVGDVIAAEEVLQWDFDARPFARSRGEIPGAGIREVFSEPELISRVRNMKIKGFRIHAGRIVSGDRVVLDKNGPEYRFLTEELEGDAVDMECAAAGITAAVNKVPFLGLKIISDNADGGIPKNFRRFVRKSSLKSCSVISALISR